MESTLKVLCVRRTENISRDYCRQNYGKKAEVYIFFKTSQRDCAAHVFSGQTGKKVKSGEAIYPNHLYWLRYKLRYQFLLIVTLKQFLKRQKKSIKIQQGWRRRFGDEAGAKVNPRINLNYLILNFQKIEGQKGGHNRARNYERVEI